MTAGATVFAGVDRVLELHQPSNSDELCLECGHLFPCPTVRALGVEG